MKVKDWRIISTYDAKRNRNKYRNQPTEVDGILFDSKKEAQRWQELKLLERAGEIRDLERQVRFELLPADPPVYPRPLEYVADFTYMEVIEGMTLWRRVVEDVKSPATRKNPVYRIKKRLLYQTYGLEIKEV